MKRHHANGVYGDIAVAAGLRNQGGGDNFGGRRDTETEGNTRGKTSPGNMQNPGEQNQRDQESYLDQIDAKIQGLESLQNPGQIASRDKSASARYNRAVSTEA